LRLQRYNVYGLQQQSLPGIAWAAPDAVLSR
jgi:hypothetical protein